MEHSPVWRAYEDSSINCSADRREPLAVSRFQFSQGTGSFSKSRKRKTALGFRLTAIGRASIHSPRHSRAGASSIRDRVAEFFASFLGERFEATYNVGILISNIARFTGILSEVEQ